MLKETELGIDFPLDELAEQTEGLSGSDLKELCRNAAMVPVREYMKEMGGDPALLAEANPQVPAQTLGTLSNHALTTSEGSQAQTTIA